MFPVTNLHLNPAIQRQQNCDVVRVLKLDFVAGRNDPPKCQPPVREPEDIDNDAGAAGREVNNAPFRKQDGRSPVLIAKGPRMTGFSRLFRAC